MDLHLTTQLPLYRTEDQLHLFDQTAVHAHATAYVDLDDADTDTLVVPTGTPVRTTGHRLVFEPVDEEGVTVGSFTYDLTVPHAVTRLREALGAAEADMVARGDAAAYDGLRALTDPPGYAGDPFSPADVGQLDPAAEAEPRRVHLNKHMSSLTACCGVFRDDLLLTGDPDDVTCPVWQAQVSVARTAARYVNTGQPDRLVRFPTGVPAIDGSNEQDDDDVVAAAAVDVCRAAMDIGMLDPADFPRGRCDICGRPCLPDTGDCPADPDHATAAG